MNAFVTTHVHLNNLPSDEPLITAVRVGGSHVMLRVGDEQLVIHGTPELLAQFGDQFAAAVVSTFNDPNDWEGRQ